MRIINCLVWKQKVLYHRLVPYHKDQITWSFLKFSRAGSKENQIVFIYFSQGFVDFVCLFGLGLYIIFTRTEQHPRSQKLWVLFSHHITQGSINIFRANMTIVVLLTKLIKLELDDWLMQTNLRRQKLCWIE